MGLMDDVNSIKTAFDTEAKTVSANPTVNLVEDLRLSYLGRKGKVTGLFENLKSATPEERPVVGKSINSLRQHIEAGIAELKNLAADQNLQGILNRPADDISLPVSTEQTAGSLHPVSLMRQTLLDEFRRMGFTVYDGPEIEFDFYNFSALNFPADHPARDMQDTFLSKAITKKSYAPIPLIFRSMQC